jgi:two-component system, OmpR family, sensor kinase
MLAGRAGAACSGTRATRRPEERVDVCSNTFLQVDGPMSAPSPYPLPRETELQVRLAEAEEAVRARDDFIAIASHELRSPMTALALRLHAIEAMSQRLGDEQLSTEIQRARRSVDRYVRRAVVLLDVSRLNTGAVALQREAVNVRQLVRNIVEAHTDEAAFHGTRLTAVVDEDMTGWWDPHMIEQILSNLVNNAVKYGGGTPVRLHAGIEQGCARFAISDSGPGIDAAQRARIFEKFERAVPTGTYRSGYGLGLWIVGRMVAAHDGAIDVETAPGRGATFVVRMPLQPPGATEGQ